MSPSRPIAFTSRFGELERTSFAVASDNPYVYKLSNIDPSGNVLAPDDAKRTFLNVNARWHTDSSFRAIPATASALSAREAPETEPGDTEFASMRVGWDTLPEEKRAAIEGLTAIHSYAYTLSHFREVHQSMSSRLSASPASGSIPTMRSMCPLTNRLFFPLG